jgi:hypothetical protein
MSDLKSKKVAALFPQRISKQKPQRQVKSRPIELGERGKVCRLLMPKGKTQ